MPPQNTQRNGRRSGGVLVRPRQDEKSSYCPQVCQQVDQNMFCGTHDDDFFWKQKIGGECSSSVRIDGALVALFQMVDSLVTSIAR